MSVGAYAGAMIIALCGAVAVAQTKVATAEEFNKAMKPAQPALRAVYAAFASKAYADARKEIARVRTAVADTQTFWVLHKKAEAVKLNKEVLAKIEAFEMLIAKDPVDVALASKALGEIDPSCRACHKQYRAQDAAGNYMIKPGTIAPAQLDK
jgi:hypothetical protein